MKSLTVTIQMKAIEKYFPVIMLFFTPEKVLMNKIHTLEIAHLEEIQITAKRIQCPWIWFYTN